MRYHAMSGLALLIMSLTSMVGSGCATRRPVDAGPLGLGEPHPADTPVLASALHPFDTATVTYEIMAGDNAGDQIVIERAPAADFNAQWQQVTIRVDLQSGKRTRVRTEYWNMLDNGDVVMPAVLDHGDHALTQFAPPLLLAPATLEPGQLIETSVDMRVVDETTRRKQREAGNATRTIELVERIELHTTDGRRFDAARVRISFNADLKMADAEDHIDLFVVEGVGIVAQTRSEQVRIMQVLGRATERTLLIAR